MTKIKSREKELFLNSAEHKPHYGIRKLTIGAASVLLSTTLFMGAKANIVKADTTDDGSGNSNITDTQNGLAEEAASDVASSSSSNSSSATQSVQSASQAATTEAAPTQSTPTTKISASTVNYNSQTNTQTQAPAQAPAQNSVSNQTSPVSAQPTAQAPAVDSTQSNAQANTAVDNNQSAYDANAQANEEPVNNSAADATASGETAVNTESVEQPAADVSSTTNYQATINYHDLDDANNYINSQTAQINNSQNVIQAADDLSKYNVEIPDDIKYSSNSNSFTITNPTENSVIDVNLTHKHDLESITKTITRTIKFEGPAGMQLPKDHIDSLTFTGTKDTDLVTGHSKTSYDQQSQTFKDFKVPKIPGYTAKITTVRGVDITAESNNLVYTITYVKNETKNVALPSSSNDDQSAKTLVAKGKQQAQTSSDKDATKINFDPTTYIRSQLYSPRTAAQLSALPLRMSNKLSLFETNLAAMDDDTGDEETGDEETGDEETGDDDSGDDSYNDDDDDDDDYDDTSDDDDSDSETADGIPSDQQDNPNIDHTYIGPDGDSRVNPHQPSGEELYGGNDNTDGPGGTIAKGDQTKWPHITPTNPNYGDKNWINFLSKRVSRKITFYYLPDDSDDTSKATQVPNAMHTDSATFTRDAYINPKTGKPYIFTGWNHSKQLITFPQIDLQNTFLNVFEGNDYSPAFMTINGKKSEFNDTIISQVANPNSNNLDVRIYLHKGRAKVKVEIRDISENNRVLETHELMGAPGASAHFDASSQLDKYLKFGYNLSANDFSQNVTFPQHANQETTHYVSLVHAIQTVYATDENPNPDNPSKNGTRKDMPNLSKSITRTIKYVVKGDDPNKPQTPKTVVQKVQYHRGITIDMVTGKPSHQDDSGNIVTEGGDVSQPTDWKLDGDKSNIFEAVDTPQLDGYTADEDLVPQEMTSPSDKNQIVTITYTPNVQKKDITRTLQPKDENGNDIGEPVIPDSQHTTITKTGTGDFKPGTFPGVSRKDLPVIPGFHVTEDVPADPNATEDKTVPVHYHSNGKIIPVDPNGNQIPGASQPRFETNPNDPTKTVPGTPPSIAGYHPRQTTINPDPTDPSKDVNVTYDPDETPGTITRVINYVDENGKPLQNPATETVNVKKDKDGKVVPNDSGRYSYYQQRISPTINNYHLVDPSQKVIPGEEAKGNKTITVKYAKNGRVIPVDQSGKPIPGADTPTFPTDSRDPSKTIPTNKPDLTNKGYQPKDGNPQVSPDPNNPSKDVTVTYVPTTQKAQVTRTIHFVYENGQPADPDKVQTVDVTEDANGTIIDNPFKKYDSVTPRVIKGYVSSVPVVEQDDANGNKEVTVTYRKIGNIIPVDKDGSPIPNADKKPFDNDPNDPSKGVTTTVPTVPDKTPSQSTATPDPSDPTKDVTVPYLDTNKAGQVQRTIHYVYKDGGTASPDTVQTVNVTKNPQGQVVGEHDNYQAVKPPVINGYVSDVSEVPEADANGDKEVTVTYSKIGNIVPVDPKTHQPIPGAPTKQLDNDPDDPSKGKTTTVPAVPGKKPSQPTADPDPNDPTKDVYIPYTDNNTQGQVTRRIHYVYDTGTTAHDDTIQSVDVIKRPDGSVIDNGQTYGAVVPPVIKGYVSNVSQVPSASATKDAEVTVTYKKIGRIVPVDPKTNQPIPGAPTKPLDNDPKDPSKGIPTKVPDVKGKTPSKPTADPDPKDPSKDVNVPYTDDTTAGKVSRTIHYKFDNGKPAHDDTVQSVDVTKDSNGNVIDQGQTYDAVKPPVINGYVSNVSEVPSDKATSDKEYTVTYKKIGRIVPVDPKTNEPIPGAPTKPLDNDPNDPSKGIPTKVPDVKGKTPSKPTADPDPNDPSKDVNVPYTDNTTAGKVNRTIHYKFDNGKPAHDDTVQSVDVTKDSNGNVIDQGQTYDAVKPPVINGYVSNVSEVPSDKATSDKEYTVTYKEIGRIVPVDPKTNQPIPNAPTKPLDNDPDDPSKGKTTEVPTVPGKRPAKPTADPDPEDPSKDVKVPYTDSTSEVTRTIHYVYKDGGTAHEDTVQTVKVDLAPDGSIEDNGQTYDKVTPPVIKGYVSDVSQVPSNPATQSTEVTVTYSKIGNVVPVDPNGNPIPGKEKPLNNDPNDPSKGTTTKVPDIPGKTPSKPTVDPDPKDPTKDVQVPYTDNNKQGKVSRTIHYVYSDGRKAKDDTVQTVDVTEDENGNVIKPGTYKAVKPDVINGYVSNVSEVPEETADQNKEVTVTYTKVGNFKPKDPNGNPIPGASDQPYKNDPNDPSKVIPDEPVPNIPGYIPDTPTVTPKDPTKDTNVTYHKASDPVNIEFKFIDQDNNNQEIPDSHVKVTGENGNKHTYSPDTTLKQLESKGYELVSKDNGYDPNGNYTDNEKGHVYTYTLKHHISNINDDSTHKSITQTVHYVGGGDNKPEDNKQTIEFNRTGQKDDVTGKVTYGPWTPDNKSTTEVKVPVVKGYVADQGIIPSNTYKPTDSDKTITVNYSPIGNIIPTDPNGNKIPGVPNTPYTNDPNDASKVIPTPVPNIPGYKPNQSTVDPKDPTKDTNVTYTPIEQTKKITRTINYVFSDGKKAHDPTTQVITIHKIGNGPWQEGTYGSVIPPVIKGYTSNVGKIPSEKSTEDKSITVTYKKVGKIVPRDPNGNPIPGAPSVDYINDPNDPSKVIITKVPQIPGYTPSVNEVNPKDPNKDTIVTYTKNKKPLAKITGKDDTYHMPAQKSDKIGVNNGNYQMPAQKADKVSANNDNYQLPAQKTTKAKLADATYVVPKQAPAAQPVKPADNDHHKATLPQTGNDDQNDKTYQLAGIGMLMAGITALGANDKHLTRIAKRRANKRKNNSGSSINNGFAGNNTGSNVVQAASGNNAANELHTFTNSNNNSENTNTNVNHVNSNNNSAIVSNVNSSNNAVNANNNTVQALNNANSSSKKLPQTGNSSELEAGLGTLLSGISMIGLAGSKKKRLD